MAAPIKNTCPDIDKYIKSIKYAIVKQRDLSRLNETDLLDVASSMSSELESCIDYLEDMRKLNGQLRDWGTTLEDELYEAATTINELEEQLLTLSTN